jgi:hypothetical protein
MGVNVSEAPVSEKLAYATLKSDSVSFTRSA